MTRVLHFLNFDSVGGVEQLFFYFLGKSSIENMLLVKNKAVHPFFERAKLQTIDYLKYFGPVKLPSNLRNWNAKRIIEKRRPDHLVAWNSKRPAKGVSCPQTYYDHGLAWFEEGQSFASELRSFDRLMACCEASKRVMQLKWGNELEVKVLPNPSLLPARNPRQLRQDKPFKIGIVGRLVSFKAQHIALHALKELEDMPVSLSVVGSGKLLSSLKKTVKDLNIQDRVEFLGDLQDMQSFYESIDLFLSPSLREPYALVVLEAMANALPVIISNIDGLPKAVNFAKAGFCIEPSLDLNELQKMGGSLEKMPKYVYSPKHDSLIEPQIVDPLLLAQKIRQVLSQKELYNTLSFNASSFAKEHLNFSTYVEKLEEALFV